jgi:hypothetical protein
VRTRTEWREKREVKKEDYLNKEREESGPPFLLQHSGYLSTAAAPMVVIPMGPFITTGIRHEIRTGLHTTRVFFCSFILFGHLEHLLV